MTAHGNLEMAVSAYRQLDFMYFLNSFFILIQVVAVCGHLPLVLAIAVTMPVVKGNGLTAGAREELLNTFQNNARKGWAKGEVGRFLNTVLEAGFDALSGRKYAELLKVVVFGPDMLYPQHTLHMFGLDKLYPQYTLHMF